MSEKYESNNSGELAEKLFELIEKIIFETGNTIYQGLRIMRIHWTTTLPYFLACIAFGAIFCYQTNLLHIQAANKIFDGPLATWFVDIMFSLSRFNNFIILNIATMGLAAFIIGLPRRTKLQSFQNSLDLAGFKTHKGNKPVVKDYYQLDDGRDCVLISSRGIGVDQYESKIVGLSSSFGRKIQEIRNHRSCVSNIEILFEGKPFASICSFDSFKSELTKPYTFPVGLSRHGPVTQNITELPHLLIAGTTGGGKSVFLNSVILGLLTSTKNIKLYLLDLKMGIEAAPYKNISNIKIAKNESEAVNYLKMIVGEMNERLEMMFDNDYNSYKDIQNEYDVIVVSVDEASVLYGKSSGNSHDKSLIEEARHLTDQIAKLARACGIHLILATQKVSKDTIDTKIRENLLGKMCFKMATIPGSSTVLGNKMAYCLPAVKGRGIWTNGNKFVEVQAPYISRANLLRELRKFQLKGKHEQ